MKTNRTRLFFAALVGLFFVTFAFAQDAAPAVSAGLTADNIVQWVTPLLVPLVLAAVKKFAPSLPSWVIPLAAPVLGVLIDLVSSLATTHSSNLLQGAVLGLLGVGLREMKEALKPAPNGGWPTVPPAS